MVKENLQNVIDDMKIACEKSGRNIKQNRMNLLWKLMKAE